MAAKGSGSQLVWSEAQLPAGLAVDVLEHLADPVFVKDRQFRWVMLNRASTEMFGHPREAMLGKSDFDFFPEAEAAFFRAKDEEVFSSERALVIDEEPLTDAHGELHLLRTTKVPLRDASGAVTHLVGIIHDITLNKAAQAALQRTNEELELAVRERTAALEKAQEELLRKERLTVLGRLAGGLAHQIRNPLGAILNATALLKRGLKGSTDSTVLQALKVLEEEAWSANRIISDLVDFVRVRRSDPSEVKVSQLVEQTLQATPLPEGVRVEKRLLDTVVNVDPLQVVGALGNLVRNASEAMNGEGTLTFTAEDLGPFVVLAVRDTGPGFAPEVMASLFQPLVTTKPLGLGLGLTTARTLIEAQGGQLTLLSAGPGVQFDVFLPKLNQPQVPLPQVLRAGASR